MSGQKHKVAVYGSLRRNQHNHKLLQENLASFLFKGKVSGYKLYPLANGSFPCICEGSGSVEVEVYEVDDTGLKDLDRLEGYPSFYDRKQIEVNRKTTTHTGIWVYYHVTPPEIPHILNGDWSMYKRHFKEI